MLNGVARRRSSYLSHAKRALYQLSYNPKKKVLPGLEPRSQDSKSYMLTSYTTEPVVMMGFEPTKHNASDLESLPFDRSGTLPILLRKILFLPDNLWLSTVAYRGTRTHDHKIKSLALYQLS